VQLFELGGWSDYLDYATLDEAIEKATSIRWGSGVRVKHRGRVVWAGADAQADTSRKGF
jgi:hypothetical protein